MMPGHFTVAKLCGQFESVGTNPTVQEMHHLKGSYDKKEQDHFQLLSAERNCIREPAALAKTWVRASSIEILKLLRAHSF